MLDDFFKEVKDNNIKTIAIDLRHCNGGDSGTLNTFLTYLNICSFKPYVMENMQNLLGIEQYNNNKENIDYNGSIYVMTSPATFSSAVIFAETLKVNKIGTLIGEPAGNAPTHYGAPETIALPHYFDSICISTQQNISPDNNRKDKFLKPDIYIPLTRDDIVGNIDPVMKWLEH
jgi:C-terminal processing protease CtpA/Prc